MGTPMMSGFADRCKEGRASGYSDVPASCLK